MTSDSEVYCAGHWAPTEHLRGSLSTNDVTPSAYLILHLTARLCGSLYDYTYGISSLF